MRRLLNTFVRPLIRPVGVRLGYYKRNRRQNHAIIPEDMDEASVRIFERVKPFTMTTPERVSALVDAVRFVSANGIPGSIVECGVWRGGSTMAAALTLKELGDETRDIYLFDTFAGMNAPTKEDVECNGTHASARWEKKKIDDNSSYWCMSPLEETRQNVLSTDYPAERIHFIKGPVEETLPEKKPSGPIAVLRLDTDWYVSTKHELTHLFPQLMENAPIIIDDYGHWQGAKQAVDEYLEEQGLQMPLRAIDYTGVVGYKPPPRSHG